MACLMPVELEKESNYMVKPRILLADDHPEVLDGLRGLLDELGEVVGIVDPEFVPVSRGRNAAPSSRGRPAQAYLRMPSRAMMRWYRAKSLRFR